MGDNGDDVAMGDRGMDEDAGRIDMRHDGHQVDSLVAGSLVHLQGIGQATMIVTRISHAADDRDGNAIDAIGRSRQSTERIRPVVLQEVSLR